MRRLLFRLFLFLFIGGHFVLSQVVSMPSPVRAEDPGAISQSADYFPDAVGNRWQYRGQISEGPLQTIDNKLFTNISTVTGVKTIKGTTVTVFHDTNGGNHGPSDSFYRRDAVGIVYYGSEPGTPLEQQLVPYQIARFPLQLALTFQQFDKKKLDFGADLDGDGANEKVDVLGSVTVVGIEPVTVPAGSYPDAVKVEARMKLQIHLSGSSKVATGIDVMTAWFAKGVGLAKYVERQELPPFRSDRGIVTEITEELEEASVKPPSASLSRSESSPEGILGNDASDHELAQILLTSRLRSHTR